MQPPTDAAQDKIKVRLVILPEKQSFENKALVQTIANGIFEHLDQASDYSIEACYTGEMAGATEFLIGIVAFGGGAFVQPFTAKLIEKTAEKAAEKAADLIEKILKKISKGRHNELSDVKAQPVSDTSGRKVIVDLNLLETMNESEITINIKISRDHP